MRGKLEGSGIHYFTVSKTLHYINVMICSTKGIVAQAEPIAYLLRGLKSHVEKYLTWLNHELLTVYSIYLKNVDG